jgi:two-component system, cell cycle sensor histidine kinase and response regulator CckA
VKKRILIVEDERIIAEDISRILKSFDYEIAEVVPSGEQALKAADSLKPDLVLMYIMLSTEMSGVEAAYKIHDEFSIPIIFLTAYADDGTISKATMADPFGYVLKPFEERELHATIQMAFYKDSLNKKLKESEKKYRTLVESMNEGIAIMDKTQNFTFVNHACANIFGTNKEHLLSRNFSEFLSENDSNKFQEQIENRKVGASDKYSLKIERDNGERRNLLIAANPMEENGRFTGSFGILSDITKQIQAEEKLHKTQFRLATVFDNVPDIVLFEKNKKEQFISENIENLLGWAPEYFIENNTFFMSLIHQEDISVTRRKFMRWYHHNRDEILTLWYRIRKKDGSYMWIESRLVEVKPEDKESYIAGVLINISPLKEVEEALRKSRAMYRTVVEDQNEFITRFLPDGTFTFVNGAYSRYRNLTSEQLTGLNWITECSAEEQEVISECLSKLSKETPVITQIFLKEYLDGTKHWTEWKYRAIFNAENEIKEIQSIGNDITDKMVAEDEKEKIRNQLHQAQKMEVVGRLAGGIAHDFNNLLTAINGYADRLKTKIAKDDELREYVEVISDTGEKAAKLTKQLLGFSRKQIVDPKVLNVNETITDMKKMLLQLIGKNIDFKMNLYNDINLFKADSGQIEQVILNLIVNARDAVGEYGNIEIKTENVLYTDDYISHTTTIPKDEYAVITVQDDGEGIKKENLERIFEPFYTTKEQDKGTGLGLSTVFGIVQQNHGFILVESEPNKFSEFKVFFPKSHEAAESAKPIVPGEEDLPQGTETILLAEDEANIRMFISEVLSEFGYKILEAANGEEALEIADSNTEIDLLLTDVRMPGIDGFELAERLKPIHPNLKVIFVSGYAEDKTKNVIFKSSESAFLQKPFTVPDLVTLIRDTLEV